LDDNLIYRIVQFESIYLEFWIEFTGCAIAVRTVRGAFDPCTSASARKKQWDSGNRATARGRV